MLGSTSAWQEVNAAQGQASECRQTRLPLPHPTHHDCTPTVTHAPALAASHTSQQQPPSVYYTHASLATRHTHHHCTPTVTHVPALAAPRTSQHLPPPLCNTRMPPLPHLTLTDAEMSQCRCSLISVNSQGLIRAPRPIMHVVRRPPPASMWAFQSV